MFKRLGARPHVVNGTPNLIFLFTVDRPIVTSPKNKSEAIEKTSRLAGQRRIDRSNHFTRPNLLAPLHIHTARGNDWPVNSKKT